jgi:hypothetical protein
MSRNIIFTHDHSDISGKKSILSEGCKKFSFHALKFFFESAFKTQLQATEACSGFDLTQGKQSFNKLPIVEKKNVITRFNPINFIGCGKVNSTWW